MSTARNLALGFIGGVVGVLTLGLGYLIVDWQRSILRILKPRRITK